MLVAPPFCAKATTRGWVGFNFVHTTILHRVLRGVGGTPAFGYVVSAGVEKLHVDEPNRSLPCTDDAVYSSVMHAAFCSATYFLQRGRCRVSTPFVAWFLPCVCAHTSKGVSAVGLVTD